VSTNFDLLRGDIREMRTLAILADLHVVDDQDPFNDSRALREMQHVEKLAEDARRHAHVLVVELAERCRRRRKDRVTRAS
jgi:hypothetical protein